VVCGINLYALYQKREKENGITHLIDFLSEVCSSSKSSKPFVQQCTTTNYYKLASQVYTLEDYLSKKETEKAQASALANVDADEAS